MMGLSSLAAIRRRLTAPEPPTAYPFGTVLQHRAMEYGPSMHTLKCMVVGRADTQHPRRIKIIRLTGAAAYVEKVTDVYADFWEPVDAED